MGYRRSEAENNRPFNSSSEEGSFLLSAFVAGKDPNSFHKAFKKEISFMYGSVESLNKYGTRFQFSERQLAWLKRILFTHGLIGDPDKPCNKCRGLLTVIPNARYFRSFSSAPEHLYAHPCPNCKPKEYEEFLKRSKRG